MSREKQILKLMLAKRGVILEKKATCDVHAIIPRGDRRCRPIGWVESTILTRLLAQGSVVKKADTYVLDDTYLRRENTAKTFGHNDSYANQHRQMEARDIYHPDGIKRPARVNTHLSALTRLARMKNKSGDYFLQPNEIEAAQRFATDYAKSMMSTVATQSYSQNSGKEMPSSNSAEHVSISALDARKRVMDALNIVGPGLDKAITTLCSSDMSIGALEVSENWAKGSGKTLFKLALARLSDFYGCQAGLQANR